MCMKCMNIYIYIYVDMCLYLVCVCLGKRSAVSYLINRQCWHMLHVWNFDFIKGPG